MPEHIAVGLLASLGLWRLVTGRQQGRRGRRGAGKRLKQAMRPVQGESCLRSPETLWQSEWCVLQSTPVALPEPVALQVVARTASA